MCSALSLKHDRFIQFIFGQQRYERNLNRKRNILKTINNAQDKNLFKCLKNENLELYKLCKKVIKSYEYEDLECVYKYIFSK